jgi:hypothetical protein
MDLEAFRSDIEEKNSATLRRLINKYRGSGRHPGHAARDDIVERLVQMGQRPDKDLLRLLHLAQSKGNGGAAYTAAVKEAYEGRRRPRSKSPRTRKAHSLLKKAMRARHSRKRGSAVIRTPLTVISGLTVGPRNKKLGLPDLQQYPKKGDALTISMSGHPLVEPVLMWSQGRDEPITPGFLADLARELNEGSK